MVHKLASDGHFASRRDEATGARVIDADDFERFARTYKPDPKRQARARRATHHGDRNMLTRRVFKCIAEGMTKPAIVIETGCTPAFASRCWLEYHSSFEDDARARAAAEAAAQQQRFIDASRRDEQRDADRRLRLELAQLSRHRPFLRKA